MSAHLLKGDALMKLKGIGYWVITIIVAFAALGIPAFSVVLSQLLLWLPNLAVAIVVLIVGGLAATRSQYWNSSSRYFGSGQRSSATTDSS